MTLYQDHDDTPHPEICPAYKKDAAHRFNDDGMCIGCFGYLRLVVPVDPCKHGNIDGHYVTENAAWCPGAGIEDTDGPKMCACGKIATHGCYYTRCHDGEHDPRCCRPEAFGAEIGGSDAD